MIKYNLKCKNNHEFESWFADSSEFEKLNKKKMLSCIYCSSKVINKSIMSPVVTSNKSKDKNINFFNKELLDDKKQLLKLREFVEKNFEFVGNKFNDKVREVYYDKKSNKGIYGTTTQEEREELEEEGIDLISIPWAKKDN
tara:strand:- start:182 stop:604 length:423 start_codon:yes stop_codon:yes gene_type:complete